MPTSIPGKICNELVGTKIADFKYEKNHVTQESVRRSMMVTFAAGLIALLFNPEARVQESPAQKTNISDEELKVVA